MLPATSDLATHEICAAFVRQRSLAAMLALAIMYLTSGTADVAAQENSASGINGNYAAANIGDAFRGTSPLASTNPPILNSPLNAIAVTSGRAASAHVYAATAVPESSLPESTPASTTLPATGNTVVCWKAPLLMQQPVYFEDVALERYGQTMSPCLQPIISTGKFAADTLLLPYKMGVDPIRRRSYVLGYARPGDSTPTVREHLPLSARGLLYQAGAATGATLLLTP